MLRLPLVSRPIWRVKASCLARRLNCCRPTWPEFGPAQGASRVQPKQYGERSVAIADYGRVTKPKLAVNIASSSYRLAQIRLQALRNQK